MKIEVLEKSDIDHCFGYNILLKNNFGSQFKKKTFAFEIFQFFRKIIPRNPRISVLQKKDVK